MQAVVLKKTGSFKVLNVSDISFIDTIADDEVIIKMRYSAINFAELLARRGLYKWVPRKKGFILGMEGAGVIEKTGKNTNFHVGDRVMVIRGFGCHAEYLKVKEKYVFPLIDGYSLIEGAAFPASYITAFIALKEMARVRPTETILIQAAAGALGTAAIQLSKFFNLKIAGTTSKPDKVTFLNEQMNIDLTINYQEEKFLDKIMEWTAGRGVDVVLESIGGQVFRDSYNCLAPMGRLVLVGLSSVNFNKWNPLTWIPTLKTYPRVNLLRMLGLSRGILAFHAGRLLDDNYLKMKELFIELVDIVKKNNIKPVIGKVFPLEEIAEAHRFIEERKNIGKIVLKIND